MDGDKVANNFDQKFGFRKQKPFKARRASFVQFDFRIPRSVRHGPTNSNTTPGVLGGRNTFGLRWERRKVKGRIRGDKFRLGNEFNRRVLSTLIQEMTLTRVTVG